MRRYEAIQSIIDAVGNARVICNIGQPVQELYRIQDRPETFYMLGSMGLALPIGLGVAMNTREKVVVIDGDAAITMNMGAMATLGAVSPDNLVHIIVDNGANGSTGFQPSFTAGRLKLDEVAKGCGVPNVRVVTRQEEIAETVREALEGENGAWTVVIKTERGAPDGLVPIPLSGIEVKTRFMDVLSKGSAPGEG